MKILSRLCLLGFVTAVACSYDAKQLAGPDAGITDAPLGTTDALLVGNEIGGGIDSSGVSAVDLANVADVWIGMGGAPEDAAIDSGTYDAPANGGNIGTGGTTTAGAGGSTTAPGTGGSLPGTGGVQGTGGSTVVGGTGGQGTGGSAIPKKILVITDSLAPSTVPQLIVSHLTSRGFVVDVAEEFNSNPGSTSTINDVHYYLDITHAKIVDFSTYNVVISSGDTTVIAKGLQQVNAPVIHSAGTFGTSYPISTSHPGCTPNPTLTVTDTSSPLAAGYKGTFVIYDYYGDPNFPSSEAACANTNSSAHVVMSTQEGASALYYYKPGDSLPDGTVASFLRIGFPFGTYNDTNITTWNLFSTPMWNLLDASVNFALGL